MKIAIYTQYKENYGAHDWDGEGQCPQYWKFKGGDTYIVEGLSQEEALEFEQKYLPQLTSLITYRSHYCEEYILEYKIVDNDAVVCEEWEAPKMITRQGEDFIALSVIKNDGYMKKEIAQKCDSYTMSLEGKRENYQSSYTLTDGQVVSADNIAQYLS